MSAIAGIVDFGDEIPAPRDLVERMAAAVPQRGSDGRQHWGGGPAALAHCALHTSPDAAAGQQPYVHAAGRWVVVLDGQLHNGGDIQHALGDHRSPWSEPEAALHAFAHWGPDCAQHLEGEFALAIWDRHEQVLFLARDAVGTRQLVFTQFARAFAFASEVNALLALPQLRPRLNERKLLDFLVGQHDRDDVDETFHEGVFKLPAGHALLASRTGVRKWRYWDPATLSPARFASAQECAEAYREALTSAVSRRLRVAGATGLMLSGGLDSSSIFAVLQHGLRERLSGRLQTYSLIPCDPGAPESRAVATLSALGGSQATWIKPSLTADAWPSFHAAIAAEDNPFALIHCFPASRVFSAAAASGCRVLLEGMGGDLMFYGPDRTLDIILRHRRIGWLASYMRARRRHGLPLAPSSLAWRALATATPAGVRSAFRSLRQGDRRAHMALDVAGDNFRLLRGDVADAFLERKRMHACAKPDPGGTDQALHASYFTGGLLSFAHEIEGTCALRHGVEQRSPFSDKRMVEFAIRMPVEHKLWLDWYKLLARRSMQDLLPPDVTWRSDVGQHPGWMFHEALGQQARAANPELFTAPQILRALGPWLDEQALAQALRTDQRQPDVVRGYNLLAVVFLAQWLHTRF